MSLARTEPLSKRSIGIVGHFLSDPTPLPPVAWSRSARNRRMSDTRGMIGACLHANLEDKFSNFVLLTCVFNEETVKQFAFSFVSC